MQLKNVTDTKIFDKAMDSRIKKLTSQILHVCRLHIHNIKTLIANFQVPKIYSKIIRRYKSFTITGSERTKWSVKASWNHSKDERRTINHNYGHDSYSSMPISWWYVKKNVKLQFNNKLKTWIMNPRHSVAKFCFW